VASAPLPMRPRAASLSFMRCYTVARRDSFPPFPGKPLMFSPETHLNLASPLYKREAPVLASGT
jgi:hypothetical protein